MRKISVYVYIQCVCMNGSNSLQPYCVSLKQIFCCFLLKFSFVSQSTSDSLVCVLNYLILNFSAVET